MSNLTSRPVIEMWAAKDCSQPGSTHWDGCPCSILRMDDRIQELEQQLAAAQAELERVTEERDDANERAEIAKGNAIYINREWIKESEHSERAEADAAMLREALGRIVLTARDGENQHCEISETVSIMEDFARAALATTPADALERQRRVQAVVTAAQAVRADLNGDEAVEREYDGHKYISPAGATIRGASLLVLQNALDALGALDAETETSR